MRATTCELRGEDVQLGVDYYPGLSAGPVLKAVLKSRNISQTEAAGMLAQQDAKFPDPFDIYGVRPAVNRLFQAVVGGESIALIRDYDSDGINAGRIIAGALIEDFGVRPDRVHVLVGNRITDGYGISETVAERALRTGATLAVTVDCGISNTRTINDVLAPQMNVIVTDHHQFQRDPQGRLILPAAPTILVHPEHPNGKFQNPYCGAAVAWHVIRGLEYHRRQHDTRYKATIEQSKSMVNKWLAYAAIATINDSVPQTGPNRDLVKMGFKAMTKYSYPGLDAMRRRAGATNMPPSSWLMNFIYGPRLNAQSRVDGQSDLPFMLLSTADPQEATRLAGELERINKERQVMAEQYIKRAEELLNQRWGTNARSARGLVVLGSGWPAGILGLVAARLAEKYYRPVFVASQDVNGDIKGSARSPIKAVNLHQTLQHLNRRLVKGGGHAGAAGFSSNGTLFANFEADLLQYLKDTTCTEDYQRHIVIDVQVDSLRNIRPEHLSELNKIEPFGSDESEFPQPNFILKNCKVLWIRTRGILDGNYTLGIELDGKNHFVYGHALADRYPNVTSNMIVDVVCNIEAKGNSLSINAKHILTSQR